MPSTTTILGIPIPLDTDPFADGALALRNAMNNLDGRFKFGTVVVPVTAASSGTQAVVFPNAFTGAGTPVIVCSAHGVQPWVANPSVAANAGFTANVRHVDNTVVTTNITVHWIALK